MRPRFGIIICILILLVSLGAILYQFFSRNQQLNYFGEAMYGQGYWLKPDNNNLVQFISESVYTGRVIEISDNPNAAEIKLILQPADEKAESEIIDLPRSLDLFTVSIKDSQTLENVDEIKAAELVAYLEQNKPQIQLSIANSAKDAYIRNLIIFK